MKLKKFVYLMIIMILIFTIIIPINNVKANENLNQLENTESLSEQLKSIQSQISDSSSKLEYVQGEISDSLEKVLKLDEQIVSTEEEMKSLNQNLETLQNQINDASGKLVEVEIRYNERSNMLKARLVALYKMGDTTYLDFLLTSSDLIDFVSNYFLISKIAEYDTNLINEVDKEKEEIEISKSKLEEQKEQLKTKKTKYYQLETKLINNKTLQNMYASKLTVEEGTLKQQIEEYVAQEQRVEYMIAAALGETSGYGMKFSGGIMTWPVAKENTYITSVFGIREHPVTGIVKNHTGIDIGGSGYGALVIAAADGVISYAGPLGGYGNCVIIDHGNGVSTIYGHGQVIYAQVGQEVKTGTPIMEVGSTGVSTGPHLHFEVRVNGVPTNPISYLTDKPEELQVKEETNN